MRYLLVLSLLLYCIPFHPMVSQTEPDKDQLIKQAQQGISMNLSPEQLQAKLKEIGLTEEQARQKAKERGVRLEDFLTGAKTGETKIQVGQPGGAGAIEVRVPTAPDQAGQAPEGANVYRDSSASPRGPGGLGYFGYEIFKMVPAAFQPGAVGPVDPGYLLGAGDVLRLTVWGQAEFQYELEVDREGRVFIPNVGQIFVLGTPLNILQQKFKLVLSKYYSGLAGNPPRTFMDVTIMKLRPIRVFVMGEVKQPGGYTISSYATVFNALYAVGGPLTRGTLRDVKVLREKKVVATVDLYDYLLRGDQTSDVRLQNNDLIFIPSRGKSVAIRGEVRRPAVYELKDKEDLKTLIEFAGGLLSTAYLDHAQIDRIRPFSERKKNTEDRFVVDISLLEAMKAESAEGKMEDADELQVFSILDQKKNYVTIQGSVWRPGRYQLGEILTIRDLIRAAEGVLPKTYLERAHLVRLNGDEITSSIISVNLGNVLKDPSKDLKLVSKDTLTVYGSDVTEVTNRRVLIYGQVKNPGSYQLLDGMTLMDLILQAGGYTEDVDLLQAEVSRVRPEGLRGDSLAEILHLRLSKDFSLTDESRRAVGVGRSSEIEPNSFPLQHRDQVLVRPNPEYRIQQNVAIEGDVKYPGTYALEKRGERVSRLIERAGGPLTTSYLGGALFFRSGTRLNIDLEKAFYKHDKDHDITVLPGDRIIVPAKPRTVLVSGEVNRPGLYTFLEGDNVGDYIQRAGGLTDSALYAILSKPTGESRRVNFGLLSADPAVSDGSTISVLRRPPEPPEDKRVDWSVTIKDSFAVIASAATIIYLVSQVK